MVWSRDLIKLTFCSVTFNYGGGLNIYKKKRFIDLRLNYCETIFQCELLNKVYSETETDIVESFY